MNSVLCVADVGVRRFVPDEFVFDVLDYLFAVGDRGWGFWILGKGQVLGTNGHGFFYLSFV